MKTQTTLFLLFLHFFTYGQFSDENFIVVNRSPKSTLITDMDGDGDNDVLVGFENGDDVSVGWFENATGAGDFTRVQSIETDLGGINFMVEADFNGDGIKDIFLHSFYMYWLPGLGNGAYDDRIEIGSSSGVYRFFTEDIDGDGDIDIVFDTFSSIMWLENDGSGLFSDQQPLPGVIPYVEKIMADVDGDNDPDFIIAEDNNLHWLENMDGNFDVVHLISTEYDFIKAITIADLDNDNDIDIALTAQDVAGPIWLENVDGLGSFSNSYLVDDQVVTTFIDMWTEDIDGDSDKDIVVSFPNTSEDLIWYENQNNSTDFGDPQAILNSSVSTANLSFGDLNNDNTIDMLTIPYTGSSNLNWRSNEDGLGNFGNEQNILRYILVPLVFPADIDNDGDTDIVIAGDDLSWTENIDGLGGFSAPKVLEEDLSTDVIYSAFVEDIDGDGDLDILGAWGFDGHKWYENLDGQGHFAPPVVISTASSDYTFFDDVDGDGDTDLFSIHSQPHRIRWLEREGDAFTNIHLITEETGNYPDAQLEDFDNDGDKDLIIIQNWQENVLYWYENNNGDFGSKILIDDPTAEFKKVSLADVNNDGWNDLVYTTFEGMSRLQWRQSTDGNGGFDLPQTIENNTGFIYQLLLEDFDGDGFKDLITIPQTLDEVNMYPNSNGSFVNKQIVANEDHWYRTVKTANINNNGGDKDLIITSILDVKMLWVDSYYGSFLINGSAFWDENGNDIKEASEPILFGQQFLLNPSEVASWSNNNGQFSYAVVPGNYDLSIQPNANWEPTGPSSVILAINSSNQVETKLFGLSPNTNVDELSTDLTSGPTRCDQAVPYWFSCTNSGTSMANGVVELELDDLINYQSAIPSPDQISGNVLTWNINELIPTHSFSVELTLNMPDANSVGDTLVNVVNVTLEESGGGGIVFEETDIFKSALLCSYDPNDKLVDKPLIDYEIYQTNGAELNYTIRFQNTGNDTAFQVRLEDQLSLDLNWETIQVIGASHPYFVYLNNDGLLSIHFDNILLPDSTTNPIQSQGYFKFKIDLKNDLAEGASISNEANIFFDGNEPVLTNSTNTDLETIVSNHGIYGKINQILLSPNPSGGEVTIEFDFHNYKQWELDLVNTLGEIKRSVSSNEMPQGTKQIRFTDIESGVYLVKINIDNEMLVKQLLVVND